MAKFIVSGRGGPFYDGQQTWPIGSAVEIRPEDYPRLLSESFDPGDPEAAQALIDHHNARHEDKPESKPPKSPDRLAALERAKSVIPVEAELADARAKADAEEEAARQSADAEAARTPDRKAAEEKRRQAYGEAANRKADAYRAAEDKAKEALRGPTSASTQAPDVGPVTRASAPAGTSQTTSVPPAQPGAPATEAPIATAPGPNPAQQPK